MKNFIAENYKFLSTNVDSKQDQAYWYQVGLIMYQIKGIEDAYLGILPIVSKDIDPSGKIFPKSFSNKFFQEFSTMRKFPMYHFWSCASV